LLLGSQARTEGRFHLVASLALEARNELLHLGPDAARRDERDLALRVSPESRAIIAEENRCLMVRIVKILARFAGCGCRL
jgi:hypothetical protein